MKLGKWLEWAACVILYLILIEIATRCFFKVSHENIDVYRNFSFTRGSKIYIPDAFLGYKLIPNVSRNALTSDFQIVYTTNSLGLRDKEIKSTSKFKILFLGDSQTFGEGVPVGSRFSDIIEREIDNVYSINAGVPGYGVHQMYVYLERSGLDLKPDLVVCSIIPTDLVRAIYKNIKSAPHLLKTGSETDHSGWRTGAVLHNLESDLFMRSYFYAVVSTRIKVWLMWHDLQERDRREWKETFAKWSGKRYKITSDNQEMLIKQTCFKIFHDFKCLTQHSQIGLLVVNISKKPIPWLEDFFRQENIDYLDASFVLTNASNISFKIDPHYNTTGNRIIAEYLKEYILQKYLK